MTPTASPRASQGLFYGAATLMLAALLLGGGGGGAPLHNMVIELMAIGVLVLTFWNPQKRPASPSEKIGKILLLLIVATPLVQLIPLPYSIWSALPGRDFVVQVDELIQNPNSWRPISLDPEATWLSAAALLPGAAMFLVVLRLDAAQRRKLALLVVAGAFLSLALGAFQMASGGGSFHLYSTTHSSFAPGLFANRNHQADLLLVGILLAAALIWSRADLPISVRAAIWLPITLALSAGVIATASRMGFLLLPIALIGALSFVPLFVLRRHKKAVAAATVVVTGAAGMVAFSAGTQRLLDRFDTLSDVRYEFWADTLVAAEKYFPWGSGLGTFATVYQAIEDLNKVGPTYVNHAHNDYIQVLVEVGIWGCLLILAFLTFFSWLCARKNTLTSPFRRAAAISILIFLLHSAVDYPLRMLSLMTLFGFISAVLVCGSRKDLAGLPKAFERQ